MDELRVYRIARMKNCRWASPNDRGISLLEFTVTQQRRLAREAMRHADELSSSAPGLPYCVPG